MYKTVEAAYKNGFFYPSEPLEVKPGDRVLLTVIPGGKAVNLVSPVTSLRGTFKGRLSTVDAFMAAKQAEKEFEL